MLFIAILSVILSGSASAPAGKTEWVIVIDPGHGGRDPGAIGSFSYEKNITLAVALKTGKYLEQSNKNIKIIYTRKTDQYVDLNERAEIANRYNADIFISIHANANKSKSSYGAETFVMGHTKDELNLEVAMKENEVMTLDNNYSARYEGFDPKSPESYIMFTLMQNAFYQQSISLASKIQEEVKTEAKRYDRGVSPAPFWVLWKTTMPSVLFEMGFITNTTEEKYINSEAGQDNLAKGLSAAFIDYMNEIEKKSIVSSAGNTEPVVKPDSVKVSSARNGTVIYMVQVSASPKKVAVKPENFKNLKDIYELYSGGRYRYTSGRFADYDKAVAYRKQIATIYPDAFVVAVKDNKIVPLQETLDKNRNKSK